MARNEEKAQAMLNKWVTMKKSLGQDDRRRPFLASDCDSLYDAERWRREIIRETTKKVADIQNAGLGEHRIRDLNDQINKLLRERIHWETRIKELGGPDYTHTVTKTFDADGRELPGGGGYKYFGAARDLPGVRELFQKSEAERPRRTRGDLYKNITPDYYGWRDEEDGVLLEKEAAIENRKVDEAVAEWRAEKRRRLQEEAVDAALGGGSAAVGAATAAVGAAVGGADEDDDVLGEVEEMTVKAAAAAAAAAPSKTVATAPAAVSAATSAAVRAHVALPDQDRIKAELLRLKKEALLAKLSEGSG
ncbi:unnamed protein product [Phaeothamnion confervicola]